MADVVDKATRSRMMAGIRGRNTNLELDVRRALHRAGFRYRLGGHGLVGKPDLVFPSPRAAVFVHGCFWHAHACSYFKLPINNRAFWSEKLSKNVLRDKATISHLRKQGWRVLILWECAVRGNKKRKSDLLWEEVCSFINSSSQYLEISNHAKGFSKRRRTARSL